MLPSTWAQCAPHDRGTHLGRYLSRHRSKALARVCRTDRPRTCGRICFNRQKINLSTVFAGQSVGIKQVSEQIWLVSFMDYDLGYFDHETCRLEPIENPFGPKVLGNVPRDAGARR